MAILSAIVPLLFVMTACTPEQAPAPAAATVPHGAMDGMPGMHPAEHEALHLSVLLGAPEDIAFAVQSGSTVLTAYTPMHKRELHLIAVRDDLRYFEHLHPSRDAGGVWRLRFAPPAGGTYRFYADFTDARGVDHVLRFTRAFAGKPGAYGLVKDSSRQKTVDGYTVTLETGDFQGGTQFNYDVLDRNGHAPVLEPYLGAKGHAVLLSASGEYIHLHPFTEYVQYQESDPPVFVAEGAHAPFYRIFLQVQIHGKILTIPFDWENTAS